MIPNDQPARGEMINRMLHTLLTTNPDLTSWKLDFISSLDEQFEKKGNLSQKQCEILERIYDGAQP